MINHYNRLSEKDRRHYAALEAMKLGHGGITYIANLFSCSRSTIYKGMEEIERESLRQMFSDDTFRKYRNAISVSTVNTACYSNIHSGITPFTFSNRIRNKGGGRKRIIDTTPNIDQVFLTVLKDYTAGSSVNNTKWTNLAPKEIAEYMAERGIVVSTNVVRQLLEKHGYVKRKMKKCRTFKSDPNRDAQFKNISFLKNKYTEENNPIICVDGKKSEPIGLLYREGKVYTTEDIESLDHDFPSYAEGKARQYGIYDFLKNECYMFINTSSDTTEFASDCIKSWWFEVGQYEYPEASSILVLADAGGSNSSRYHIFKYDLQQIANEMGIEIRMAHFPPYTSKYNPIDHRVFCHITRACQGVLLRSVELLKELVEQTKTSQGLKVAATIVDKVYETKRKVSDDFKENMPIVFDALLGKWNYRAIPQ